MSPRLLLLVVAAAFATVACGGGAAATSGPTYRAAGLATPGVTTPPAASPTVGPTYAEDNSTPPPASEAPSQGPAATPASTPAATPAATLAGNPGGAAASVVIFDNGFQVADLTIAVGTTVTWTNTGQRPHTVKSVDGGFTSSGTLSSGSTYEQTFGTAGTFAYVCAIHATMHGTITVTP